MQIYVSVHSGAARNRVKLAKFSWLIYIFRLQCLHDASQSNYTQLWPVAFLRGGSKKKQHICSRRAISDCLLGQL